MRDGVLHQIAALQLLLVVVLRAQNYVVNDQDVTLIFVTIVKHVGILIKHVMLPELNALNTMNEVHLSVSVKVIHNIVCILYI